MRDMDDQECLGRARAGDPTAFGALVERYHEVLCRYVAGVTGDASLAQLARLEDEKRPLEEESRAVKVRASKR